jgi:hypothetical protein
MTLSAKAAQKFTVLIMIGIAVDFGTVIYVGYANYQGRVALVDAQRKGCERGKLDREANATGWRTAQAARLASGQFAVAKKYGEIAAGQEARSKLDCNVIFPDAEVIP